MEKSSLDKMRELQPVNAQNADNNLPKKSNNFFIKYRPTFTSMALSFFIYIVFIEWKLTVGFLLLLLLHEIGHSIAAKNLNVKVGVPIFIPLLGAFVTLEEKPRTTYVQSVISLGGPLAGLLGALASFILGYFSTSSEMKNFFYILAWFTALINYLNLIPFMGLDGAGISKSLNIYHWGIFLLLFPLLIFWFYDKTSQINPIMLIIFISALIKSVMILLKNSGYLKESLIEKLKNKDRFPDENQVSSGQRFQSLIGYLLCSFGLTAILIYSELLMGKSPWSP